MRAETVKRIARECGFELAGIAPADPPEDFARYQEWVANGFAGEMRYLTDRRAQIRGDVHHLLPTARSVICVGKLYNQPTPPASPDRGNVARYAWGQDYHDVVRAGLEQLAGRLREIEPFESKICVDTAPLLERSFARRAGLGWIGKNTCLIHEPMGSWFFLGELITSLELEPDIPAADRCGTCTRCIDACPTQALLPAGDGFTLDSRRCISYFTIELRGPIPEEYRADIGTHILGCDICQDVCPWNTRAPETAAFDSVHSGPDLEECSRLSEEQFRSRFKGSALSRPRYSGFLRNVAIAMGNSELPRLREPLEALTRHADPVVAEHSRWALKRLDEAADETLP